MTRVRVLPGGVELDVRRGESVLEAALRDGWEWPTNCYGQSRCAACHVVVISGAEQLAPPDAEEQAMLDRLARDANPASSSTQRRLACRLAPGTDLVLELRSQLMRHRRVPTTAPDNHPHEEIIVTDVRFNHMELTFRRGTLNRTTLSSIDAFYGTVFGWSNVEDEVGGQPAHILGAGDQFILLAESDTPMESPGLDHLGLLVRSRDEVDGLLDACRRFREKDDRVEILEFEDITRPEYGITQHFFYVRYLLPLYFDVHCTEII